MTFLGTSGQNVEDIDRYSTETERLPMLARLLEWGHLVPTAPDTLTAYSFPDRDPFVIDAAPHVLFAGNQPSFATRLVEGARPSVQVHQMSMVGDWLIAPLSQLRSDCQPVGWKARGMPACVWLLCTSSQLSIPQVAPFGQGIKRLTCCCG